MIIINVLLMELAYTILAVRERTKDINKSKIKKDG
jgi:hypothetical protein